MSTYRSNGGIFEYKASTKDILWALVLESQWLDLISDVDKDEDSLIGFLQKQSRKADANEYWDFPIKAIAEEIGISPVKITKILNKLYVEIWELNLSNPKLFFPNLNYASFNFTDNYTKNTLTFNLNLTHPISVGDKFIWGFLKGKFGDVSFKVLSRHHEHTFGYSTISINLNNGISNSYRELLIEKARFLNLIRFDEMAALSDYKIDQLLRHRVEKGLSGFPSDMVEEAKYFSARKRRW